MTVPEAAVTDLLQAIYRVQAAAELIPTSGETITLRQALTAVRDAVLDAADTLNRAEEEARLSAMENANVHA